MQWLDRFYRHLRARIGLIIAAVFGMVIGLLVPLDEPIARLLAGWNAAGWLYVTVVIIMMTRAEIEGIKRQANVEEGSRAAVLILTILGALAMLLAIVAQLSALSEERGLARTITFALSFSTILVSWLLVHIVFALYYAHEFHSESHGGTGGSGGGLEFPRENVPDYLDFLYFSLVVGTTAQTSDIAVSSRAMRHVVMLHGLVSFFFNATVIALVVNLTALLAR